MSRESAVGRRAFLSGVAALGLSPVPARSSAGPPSTRSRSVEPASPAGLDPGATVAHGTYTGTALTTMTYPGTDGESPADVRSYESAAEVLVADPVEGPASWDVPAESNPFHLRASTFDSRLASAEAACTGVLSEAESADEFAGDVSVFSAGAVSEPGVAGGVVIDFWRLERSPAGVRGTLRWNVFDHAGMGGAFNAVWAPHGCRDPYGLGVPLPFDMLPGATLSAILTDERASIRLSGAAAVYEVVAVSGEYVDFETWISATRD